MKDYFKDQCTFAGLLVNDFHGLTHTMLNGGKLRVPTQKRDIFMNIYTNSLKNNHPVYVSELFPEMGPFTMELDFYTTEAMIDTETQEKIRTLLQCTYLIILENFMVNDATCIETRREAVKDNGKGLYKQGIHFHFPDIIVHLGTFQRIRTILLRHILKEHDKLTENTEWKDALDENIFRGKGLRLYKSQKIVDPNHVQNAEGEQVYPCNTHSLFVKNCKDCFCFQKALQVQSKVYDVYKVWMMNQHSKKLKPFPMMQEELQMNLEFCVQKLSFYRTQPVQTELTKNAIVDNPAYNPNQNQDLWTQITSVSSSSQGIQSQVTVTEQNELMKILHKLFPVLHNDPQCKVTKMVQRENHAFICLSTKFCPNIEGIHNNNHMYIVVGQDKAYMKCRCTCSGHHLENRKTIPCSQWKLDNTDLKEEFDYLLFRCFPSRKQIEDFNINLLNAVPVKEAIQAQLKTKHSVAPISNNFMKRMNSMFGGGNASKKQK